jgi:hypothetical protein
MPDLLVISLLIIGPIGIWFLMRHLNKPAAGTRGGQPPAPPEG